MRIAMVIEAWKPIWAGGQIHVWNLCENLVNNHNCKIDLFVMNLGGKKVETYYKGRLRIYKIGKKCKFSFKARLKWLFDVYSVVKKFHTKENYDLIHGHANLPGIVVKKLSKKLKIPCIYTIHGNGLSAIKDMYGKGLKSSFIYSIENHLHTKIKYSHEITVDSSLLNHKNVNKNISVIPNGVNITKYDSVKAIKSKKFKTIFVGRLHPQKGLRYLIRAVSLIKNELKDEEFHIIGNGVEDKFLKDLAKELKVYKFFKFKGAVYGTDLIKEYKSAHLFILPSLYEGQPLTLLEAWAAKLPVIVTGVGGNKDFVNKSNGYIIKSKDVLELSKTILVAIKNKNLNKLGLNGYNLVKENYTWDKVADETFEVYEGILK
jgi:glycosyltransferase involved in cell wall biosynthesis